MASADGHHDFVRPPKSPARHGRVSSRNGSVTMSSTPSVQSIAGAPASLSQSAVQGVQRAYEQAPDLGITTAVQSTYNRAPDLGVSSTIERWTGGSGPQQQAQQRAPSEQHSEGGRHSPQQRQQDTRTARERLYDLSREHGPSSDGRIGKSQNEIGTEYGIPTRAGAGTTVSPDKTNQNAIKQSKAGQQANVPQDYLAEPCPEDNAGTGKVDDVQSQIAKEIGAFESKKSHSAARPRSRMSKTGGEHRKKDGDLGYVSAASKRASMHETSGSSSSTSKERRKSVSSKWRNQIRGEFKILKGSLFNNYETINAGILLKQGGEA